jgi:hypothetical protein
MQENRKHMGKSKKEVIIPIAPSMSEIGDEYSSFIADLKESIRKERLRIVLNANSNMMLLYWNIGKRFWKSKLMKDGELK